MPEIILIAFYLIILFFSIIIHEVSHGFMALWLGDSTAKYAERLNFNPKNHIDLWGSVLVPLMMLFMTNFRFAFGWAKPVPYNPYNLKNQKWGPALVGLAGPFSNIIIALAFAILARFITLPLQFKYDILQNFTNWSNVSYAISHSFGAIFFELVVIIIYWNVLLAVFNLIPIPPLDGSKLLFSILPMRTETKIMLEQFGFVFLLMFIFLFSEIISPIFSIALNFFFRIAIG